MGRPAPAIEERPRRYLAYFENKFGEQLLFVHDDGALDATVFHGNADWEPRRVTDASGLPEVGDCLWLCEQRRKGTAVRHGCASCRHGEVDVRVFPEASFVGHVLAIVVEHLGDCFTRLFLVDTHSQHTHQLPLCHIGDGVCHHI